MSKRDWKIIFEDILSSIEKIESYAGEISFDDFASNSLLVDAVVRNIEIIGEASKFIPDDVREKYTDVPWAKLRGIRNRIVHEYFDVDVTIIWVIIKDELPLLKQILNNHLTQNLLG